MDANGNYRIARHCGEKAMFRKVGSVRLFGLAVALALGAAAPAWAHGITERVNLGPGGVQGNGDSFNQAISPDGRFVAFDSSATNLVPGDTNGAADVFVRDRKTGTTERVSLGPGGVQGNGASGNPVISADGRFVAFESQASNLVPGGTKTFQFHVFVHDRKTGTTELVSRGPRGVQGNDISLDPVISMDGCFIAFDSAASNLVRGGTNGAQHVFVFDRKTGINQLVSVGSGGVQGNDSSITPSISADGRFVAFDSDATNLVPGDTNHASDVFVRDRKTGMTSRVSLGSGGVQGNRDSSGPAISADGRFVAFDSLASNLVPSDHNGASDVFIHDRQMGTTERVSLGRSGVQGNEGSFGSAISPDGRFVAFQSDATNLVPGDTDGASDVFVHNRKTGMTRRVSLGAGGVQGNGGSGGGAISADGRIVAFLSDASNLVPGDTNDVPDVFVRTLVP